MRHQRFTAIAILLGLLLLAAPGALAADFGVRAGRWSDSGEEFLGAELVVDLGAINLNPNVEVSTAEDVTGGDVNLDVYADFGFGPGVDPYFGAGLGIRYADFRDRESRTDLRGSLIAGVQFELGVLRPYAQLRYAKPLEDEDAGGDGSDTALMIGVRF